ncbi:hypothetical protein [Bacillus sp. OTU2372]
MESVFRRRSIITVGDTFYWYGENKEKTKAGSGIWHWGVRCYSSKDLYNWEDKGIIIPPNVEDENSPLHPSQFMDRPHIIFNEKTGKFVMLDENYEKRRNSGINGFDNLNVDTFIVGYVWLPIRFDGEMAYLD